MEPRQTLATEYDILSRAGRLRLDSVPQYIVENLNPAFTIRPYQQEALLRWLDYYESTQPSSTPLQLLFNMATGSGKTLIMAALIIDLYRKGYRNFIFFVDTKNIVEKTKDNFLNIGSPKYLFNDRLVIDGQPVTVMQVDNFEGVSNKDINIYFTTTAGLHNRLNNPAENSVTYEELATDKLVLLSDEAHHINAETKSTHTKTEQEQIRSWEFTVRTIVDGHPDNVLLEFTATIDTKHPAIFEKYKDRILYQYDLGAFRQDGYSKDVLIYDVAAEPMDRMLQAIVVSQYRKKVALAGGVYLKPVVLFKSRTTSDNKEFYEVFIRKLAKLSSPDIEPYIGRAEGILRRAFSYFAAHDIDIEGLVSELKNDFYDDHCVLVDSKNIVDPETQIALNRLEELDNPIRAIFTVDILNEGWDVLNLFDIVRLYDTRDAKAGRPGATTIAEAQLIGRGARYYPFGNEDDRDKRKYDLDIDNDMRAIEQLHYHSAHNPKYIQEISQALRDTGIMAEETQELEMVLKDSFKQSRLWRQGFVWVNRRVKNDNLDILSLEDKGMRTLYAVELPTGHSREVNPFVQPAGGDEPVKRATKILELVSFGTQVIRKALDRDPFFTFANLNTQFGNLTSISEFIISGQYLGGVSVELTADAENLDELAIDQRLFVIGQVLKQLKTCVAEEDVRWQGTETFDPLPMHQAIKERVRLKIATSESADREYGRSTYQSEKYHVDLHNRDWYAYSDNFGTSEEKSLVKTIDALMHELEAKWDDIHLIRNEGFIKIYAFDDGAAFEPDFILFANDRTKQTVSWQVFIEPKGSQFLGDSRTFDDGKEGWKQRFLLQIKDKFKTSTLLEDENFRVVGLPFYNEKLTKEQFVQQLSLLGID